MQRTIFKPLPSTEIKTAKTTRVLDINDFQVMLTNRLQNLTLDETGIDEITTAIANDARSPSSSLRSPLSRQESRQNSLLSLIIDPNDDKENEKDNNNNNDNDSNHTSRDGSTNGNKRIVRMYCIPDLIHVLGLSTRAATRNGIGKLEREMLFAHMYRMIISSNSELYMGSNGCNDEDFQELCGLENNVELEIENLGFEWEIWIKCVISYACIGVDEVASDVVSIVFPLLFRIINKLEIGDLENREFKMVDLSIWSLMSLILFIFYDSENYGMLEHTKLFLNYLSNDKTENDEIISGCLYMIGLTLSLAWESGRKVKNLIEDEVLEVIKLTLNNKKRKNSKIAAAVLAGLCFELTNDEDQEDEKEEEQEEIDNTFLNDEMEIIKKDIEILANEGAKKAGKKGKIAKNIFREVFDTLNESSNSANFELDAIPVTKTKNITVNTWFAYIRVQILRFVLGNELSNWMAKSRDIRNMLKKSIKNGNIIYNPYEVDMDEENENELNSAIDRESGDYKSKKDLEKERTKRLAKQRRVKEEQLE
jgi:hypothetical protein